MIFITRRHFEDEMYKKMREIDFRNETERKIINIEQKIADLDWRIKMLEDPPPTPVGNEMPHAVGMPTTLSSVPCTKNP